MQGKNAYCTASAREFILKPYYEDSHCQIFHGNCLEILPAIQSVEHLITDPPYSRDFYQRMRTDHGSNRTSPVSLVALKAGEIGDINELFTPISKEIGRVLKRWGIVFSDLEFCQNWREALVSAGLDYIRTGAWVKPNSLPQMSGDRPGVGFEVCTIVHPKGKKEWNGGGKPALWTHYISSGTERPDHPCPKPIKLMKQIIAQFTDENETILDPFAGSCTTGRAAKDLNRKSILIEMEEKYCEIGANRMTQEVLQLGM